jgi:CubicO group peptidase (beta-lactamase class C family)
MKQIIPSIIATSLWVMPICAPVAAHAQAASRMSLGQVKFALPQLERYTQDVLSKTGVPGASVAIVFEDQVVYLKGFGLREANKKEPVTEDTVFQLASVSKPIASTVVAALVSDGQVSWDSRISDLDPAFKLHDPYPTSQLTIRDLFMHRSGLPGEAGTELESLGYDRDAILHRLRFMPLASSFRSAYSYSDFGITEGAVAAVKPTGQTWEDVSADKLYAPLGMTHMSSRYADFVKETNRAALHILVNGKWTPKLKRDADAQSPGGGVSSSARDMAQWIRLELANGKYDGKQLIRPEALAETHLPLIIRGPNPITGKPAFYGLGWNVDYDSNGRVIWNHAGAFSAGARAVVELIPSEHLGIVVLSNAFPTGLPEAVAYTFFDLVHRGKPRKDWLTVWNNLYDALFGPAIKASKTMYGKPLAHPTPALSAAAYVGTYRNDYIGKAHVVEQESGLALQLGPRKKTFSLKHWNRDVFLYHPAAEAPDLAFTVTFMIGSDSKANQVVISDLNTNGQGVLLRVAKQ